MCVRVGFELLELARAAGARAIFVVGIGREVGKTTVVRAVYDAARRRRAFGPALASMNPRHRFRLRPQTRTS